MINMVDYDRLVKKIRLALTALAAGGLIMLSVKEYQKDQSKKAFDKLPKAQQEIVIKLKDKKIPEKTIQINLNAYSELNRIGKSVEDILNQEQNIDSIKVTTKDEITTRLFHKNERKRILVDLLLQTENNEQLLTVLGKENAEVLKKAIKEMIAETDAQIKDLNKSLNK
jgi:hypothetical protein